ncbi:hypothetical protein Q5762_12595 [Streptomyces sp. P9(2023)]|uniref:hypothetical protein n=1 Tax=Streptomyces sp. P9(2023) TaxID=3064394 RepID=UPI0028F436D4|nr:hypothetical protein [Streptomyces sp. P9(2023)]MDT9689165.1 hypothetical protein [Streptomyces sp. P9(2023)]
MTRGDSGESPDRAAVLREIGAALVEAVPEGWRRVRFEFFGTVQVDSALLESVSDDGSASRHSVPRVAMREFDRLRSTMYRPGAGTWFTARYVIERSGESTIDFDHDNEPGFVPQLTAGAYLVDFERFPRDEENTPEWLRDRLREARAARARA